MGLESLISLLKRIYLGLSFKEEPRGPLAQTPFTRLRPTSDPTR